jgi:hypothetical protein
MPRRPQRAAPFLHLAFTRLAFEPNAAQRLQRKHAQHRCRKPLRMYALQFMKKSWYRRPVP